MSETRLPAGLELGVSTSAYQIEGAASEDGRSPSVWDTFTHRDGTIADGSTGDVACDHYHRVEEDLDLLARLGVQAYRFSLSWSRIQPGHGRTSTPGLDFYDRLVDGLLARGISPVATLFHWDLPQWLQDEGGWQQRDTAERFAEYAEVSAARLGDRVAAWSTMNEMFEHFTLGHVLGTHAPGLTLPLERAFAVAHHLLLAHGRAARVLRPTAPVMVVNSYASARPATDDPADRDAAGLYDLLQNRLFTDPILLGRYPEEALPLVEPWVREGDLATISSPIDRMGVNYYSINAVRAVDGPVPLEIEAPAGYPQTAFGWAIAPEGLTEVLVSLRERYGVALPPLVVTENGCSVDDVVENDTCHDPDRVRYLASHLAAVGAAVEAGVDVRGYYVWSLLDNFEWAEGYTKRFGLVHVDFATQRRTPKTSYSWFRDVAAAP